MHPPTGKLSKLSLNTSSSDMGPVTRSQSSQQGGGSTSGQGGDGDTTRSTQHGLSGNPDEPGDSYSDNDLGNSSDDDDDDDGPVHSPATHLSYRLDNLDSDTKELVRELFRRPGPDETPPMVIEWCGVSNDPDVYAFQLHEVVPRTIRIGSPSSRIPEPVCNCMGGGDVGGGTPSGSPGKPCRHLIWLMDQIAQQTLVPSSSSSSSSSDGGGNNGQADTPLVLDHHGFPQELGNAYAQIAAFHIGILANTLHCASGSGPGRPSGVGTGGSGGGGGSGSAGGQSPSGGDVGRRGLSNAHRIREAREILAGLAGIYDDASVDMYAPEIFDIGDGPLQRLLWGSTTARHSNNDDEGDASEEEEEEDDDDGNSVSASSGNSAGHVRQRRHRRLVERGDLQRTVLRLLVANDEFFAMFLQVLEPHDKARDPFRKIQQRIECVLDMLLMRGGRADTAGETATVTVAWAARHVRNAVTQIGRLLAHFERRQQEQQEQQQQQRRRRRLPKPRRWPRRSATLALVWIFHTIVFRHNRDAHAGATQDDRNLYQRLIGNEGGTGGSSDSEPRRFFLLDQLQPLHDQVQFRTALERIRHRVQLNGYRETYMHKLDSILAAMRAAEAAGVAARHDSGDDSRDNSNDNDSSSGNDDDDDDDDSLSPILMRPGRSSSSAVGSKRRQVSAAGASSSGRGVKRIREAGSSGN